MLKALSSIKLYVVFVIFQVYFAHLTYADNFGLPIEELLELPDTRFNGVVLITQNENILYQTARGSMDFSTRIPLDEDNQFIIGSISKQITSVLLLRALDAGLLKLDIPIKNYLPELQDKWAKHIHLHHLLNHTSGIEAVGSPLNFKPGKAFGYSNRGYDLIGRILERITNKSYETLVEELFQEECGVFNTTAPPSGSLDDLKLIFPKLALGWVEDEGTDANLPVENSKIERNPSGGNISTVYDLWAWNTALHGGKLLSEESYALMTTPLIKRDHRWGKIGYGYGIQISHDEGIQEMSHNGFIRGYTSTLLYYPQEKISVIILENRASQPHKWDIPEQKCIFHVQDIMRNIVRSYILKSKE